MAFPWKGKSKFGSELNLLTPPRVVIVQKSKLAKSTEGKDVFPQCEAMKGRKYWIWGLFVLLETWRTGETCRIKRERKLIYWWFEWEFTSHDRNAGMVFLWVCVCLCVIMTPGGTTTQALLNRLQKVFICQCPDRFRHWDSERCVRVHRSLI